MTETQEAPAGLARLVADARASYAAGVCTPVAEEFAGGDGGRCRCGVGAALADLPPETRLWVEPAAARYGLTTAEAWDFIYGFDDGFTGGRAFGRESPAWEAGHAFGREMAALTPAAV